ncbi:MAG: phosphatase PAP2 family protein [Proteobacteria bacterium]|nr:phosphatase PAP2 family protein [Pseudomonadota bacterium]
MDEWLWSWLEPQGRFLLEHIGWWLIAAWLGGWLIILLKGNAILEKLTKMSARWKQEFRLWLIPFPLIARLLSARFNRQQLTGWPLTLLIAVLISTLLLLAGVVESFVEQDFMVQLDHWVAQNMAVSRSDSVIKIFHTITMMGTSYVALSILLLISLVLSFWGNKFLPIPLIISFFGSVAVAGLAKYGFARPRPIESSFVEHSPSFPSGHATLAMSFYAVLFYLWWRQATSWAGQVWVLFLGSSFISLLAMSRIIIGVHYVSDVIAGLLLGTLWFLIAISLYEWLNTHKHIHLK